MPAAGQALSASRSAQIEGLLDRALVEHKIFLTCTATMPQTYDSVASAWEEAVTQVTEMLSGAGYAASALETFRAAAAIEALVMADAPLSEVAAFCRQEADWESKFYIFDFVHLGPAVRRVLAQ